jgi:hypothetical protein
VIHGVFELREEIAISLSDGNNSNDANLYYIEGLIQILAYLVDFLKETK